MSKDGKGRDISGGLSRVVIKRHKDDNKPYIIQHRKIVEFGKPDTFEVTGPDFIIQITPREIIKPARVMIAATTGQNKVIKDDPQLTVIEIFVDKNQVGITKNPIQVTQEELIESKENK